jgi:seryl-tRNA(Sec) selenium transferase
MRFLARLRIFHRLRLAEQRLAQHEREHVTLRNENAAAIEAISDRVFVRTGVVVPRNHRIQKSG